MESATNPLQICGTSLLSECCLFFILRIQLLPATAVKGGIVLNLSVCVFVCVSTNQKVVLDTCLVVWTTT